MTIENWEKYIYYFDAEHLSSYQATIKNMRSIVSFKNKNILCLGSGTGYYPISYLELGAIHVTCLDISEEFLNIIKDKLSKRHQRSKERIDLHMASMADFNINNKFDYIFCNGDSFSCLLDQNEQVSCLKHIKSHLKDSGMAYISTYPLSNKLKDNFKSTYNFIGPNGSNVTETVTAKIDYINHRLDYCYEYVEDKEVYKHIIPTRILTLSEMKLLFKIAGLEVTQYYGDLYSQNITDDSFEWIFELKASRRV